MKNDNLKLKILRNAILCSLLLLVFFIPFMAMLNFSPAYDEVTHLPSGYSYLRTGEIKLNPQHPPFIKIIAALPLLFLDLKFDPIRTNGSQRDPTSNGTGANDPNLVGPQTNEWQFGRNFLSDNGVDRVLFWGRIPMILLSVLLGFYVFKWGKEMFSYRAGVFGLMIYAFMPNLITHAQFVATDMGLAVFSFISVYYFWRLLKVESRSRVDLVLTGVFLGLALGSKFSAIFLLPVFPVLSVVYFIKKPGLVLYKFNSLLKIILPIYGLAFLVVWALYFFPSDPLFYWKGLKTVYADNNPTFEYYLNGNFKEGGWWYYFLEAFIIKTPIPFLIAILAAFLYLKKNGLNFLNNLVILLPVALFIFVTSWRAHNIGVRYILPMYPFLILFVSGYLSEKFRASSIKIKTAHVLILILGSWYIFSSVNAYPDYLAYFNELVGGSKNGYKYLDDSNIDWGHDLKRLAEYQKDNPNLKVALWTSADAAKFYSINNILPHSKIDTWLNPTGKYAVSINVLIRMKLASQLYKNDSLNWVDLYKPTDRIGQSFFIYEFP